MAMGSPLNSFSMISLASPYSGLEAEISMPSFETASFTAWAHRSASCETRRSPQHYYQRSVPTSLYLSLCPTAPQAGNSPVQQSGISALQSTDNQRRH